MSWMSSASGGVPSAARRWAVRPPSMPRRSCRHASTGSCWSSHRRRGKRERPPATSTWPVLGSLTTPAHERWSMCCSKSLRSLCSASSANDGVMRVSEPCSRWIPRCCRRSTAALRAGLGRRHGRGLQRTPHTRCRRAVHVAGHPTAWTARTRSGDRAVAAAWIVQGVGHLAFHAAHLHGVTGADRVGLLVSLAVVPVLAVAAFRYPMSRPGP